MLGIGIHDPEKKREYIEKGLAAIRALSPERKKEIQAKGALKRRKLTQEQLDFIKEYYEPSTNQFDKKPGKMSKREIAKQLNVSLNCVVYAIKNLINPH
jgi:hypothetical protein